MKKVFFLIVLMLIPQSVLCSDSLKLNKIKLPQNFGIELYAANTGNNFEIYARGVRNSAGFDWHPVTGNLWFTDNGTFYIFDKFDIC